MKKIILALCLVLAIGGSAYAAGTVKSSSVTYINEGIPTQEVTYYITGDASNGTVPDTLLSGAIANSLTDKPCPPVVGYLKEAHVGFGSTPPTSGLSVQVLDPIGTGTVNLLGGVLDSMPITSSIIRSVEEPVRQVPTMYQINTRTAYIHVKDTTAPSGLIVLKLIIVVPSGI
jgi:hypothetical protein